MRPGARARDFEESLMWLDDYGIITRVPRASALRTPLSSYADPAVFKLFVSDIGLLGALADLDPAIVLNSSAIFTEFKGALTKQLVCQQLVAQQYAPYYWANPQGHAEVDFAVEQYGKIYPIEVKATVNLRAKSLHVACGRFHLDQAFRMAMTDYRDEGWITNFPCGRPSGSAPISNRPTKTDRLTPGSVCFPLRVVLLSLRVVLRRRASH